MAKAFRFDLRGVGERNGQNPLWIARHSRIPSLAGCDGGLNAGKGFDFQTRYTVCHLPIWLQDGSFHQIFTEGTGDIDIRYVDEGKSRRKHIQTKDHDVAPAEFKDVIEAFRRYDADMPGTYQEFRLACPSLSQQMRPVETGLARFRNAKPFMTTMFPRSRRHNTMSTSVCGPSA